MNKYISICGALLMMSHTAFAEAALVCDNTVVPGSYFRAQGPLDIGLDNLGTIQLNADGTAITFSGEGVLRFIGTGLSMPGYGQWQCIDNKVVYTTLTYFTENAKKTFGVERCSGILEFDSDNPSKPIQTARSIVQLDPTQPQLFNTPGAGVLQGNTTTIRRPFEKVQVIPNDLTRTQ